MLVLDNPYTTIIQGAQVMVHSYSTKTAAKLEKLIAVIDKLDKDANETKRRPKKLVKDMVAKV